MPQLRPRYFVGVERRVYVLGEDDEARRLIIPDVTVTGGQRPARSNVRAGTAANAHGPPSVSLHDAYFQTPR